MRTNRKRIGVEAGAIAAIVAVTLATWSAAGVFSPSRLLHAFEPGHISRSESGQVVLASPASVERDTRATATSVVVAPAVLAALAASSTAPARVASPRPIAAPKVATPLGSAVIDPAAGRVSASAPATPVTPPVRLSVDGAPLLAPVTNTVGGVVGTVGGVVGSVVGGLLGGPR